MDWKDQSEYAYKNGFDAGTEQTALTLVEFVSHRIVENLPKNSDFDFGMRKAYRDVLDKCGEILKGVEYESKDKAENIYSDIPT